MLRKHEWATFGRLIRWLEPFRRCFGHRAQYASLQAYVEGLLSDSPRKSMGAMLARVTHARSYQAFQHFITHAPWDPASVWKQLRAQIPERRGVLLLDDTAFLKQGTHSVGVSRQFASARHHVTNCQVAVTAALWARGQAWFVGAQLYLPAAWLTPAQRQAGKIPATYVFREKWRLAFQLVQQVRAAGLLLDAIVADAGYGNVVALRTALARAGLRYLMGISSDTTVLEGTPPRLPPRPGPGAKPRAGRIEAPVRTVSDLAASLPARAWRTIEWGDGARRWAAQFAACRVCPAALWRTQRRLEECWLLCERAVDGSSGYRFYLSNLPPTTTLRALARLAHQRWPIEQQYSELKTELGLDHFEGRSYLGWHRHIALGAVAHAFLQMERRRRVRTPLTFPQIHALVQEILAGLLILSRPRYLEWLEAGRKYVLRI